MGGCVSRFLPDPDRRKCECRCLAVQTTHERGPSAEKENVHCGRESSGGTEVLQEVSALLPVEPLRQEVLLESNADTLPVQV